MHEKFDEITEIEIILNNINLLSAKAKYFCQDEIFYKLIDIKNKIYYNYEFFNYKKLSTDLLKINELLKAYEK